MLKGANFRYLRDPVFLFATFLYVLNRLLIAPLYGAKLPFLINYFGDALLIPCALPILLWLQRFARLRDNDGAPTVPEILGTLVFWAVLFEWLFPRFAGRGVSDPLDVLAYAVGALLAGAAWHERKLMIER